MVSMSLPHSSEESASPYFLCRHHRKRDEDGYLFTSTHIRVLFAFSAPRKLLVLVSSEDPLRSPHLSDGMRRPVSTGCDTLPIVDALEAQRKGDRL